MAKIQFRSGKTKTKVFEDSRTDNKSVLPEIGTISVLADKQDRQEEQAPQKQEFRNAAEVYEYLYSKLTLKYNIDTISVYQLDEKKSADGRLHYKKIYGTDISTPEIERYFGYNCPFVKTNASGFTDNRMHRARFIELFGNRLIVVSSSAFEVFRSQYDMIKIRNEINTAFKEVERF